MVVSKI